MRTTISLPSELVSEIERQTGGQAFAEFAREAIRERLDKIKKERSRLARELEKGYQAEAEESSLEPKWAVTETEGW